MSEPSYQAVIEHMLKNDRFSAWLGIEVLELQAGFCKITMVVREEMMNGFNIAHGGITFSFADSALAIASNGYNKLSVALETAMSFTAPVKSGDQLTAMATEISKTNKIGVYNIEITNQQQLTVGLFKGTVYRTSKTLLDDE
ncbi:MAG: phenylacetic acid degradation protein PaaD [Cyclobacteriaceae bacterium]|nr:MAG: phenylacetic acid degradation protein PaaD [Cyclobacteriaceae bacterium]